MRSSLPSVHSRVAASSSTLQRYGFQRNCTQMSLRRRATPCGTTLFEPTPTLPSRRHIHERTSPPSEMRNETQQTRPLEHLGAADPPGPTGPPARAQQQQRTAPHARSWASGAGAGGRAPIRAVRGCRNSGVVAGRRKQIDGLRPAWHPKRGGAGTSPGVRPRCVRGRRHGGAHRGRGRTLRGGCALDGVHRRAWRRCRRRVDVRGARRHRPCQSSRCDTADRCR